MFLVRKESILISQRPCLPLFRLDPTLAAAERINDYLSTYSVVILVCNCVTSQSYLRLTQGAEFSLINQINWFSVRPLQIVGKAWRADPCTGFFPMDRAAIPLRCSANVS